MLLLSNLRWYKMGTVLNHLHLWCHLHHHHHRLLLLRHLRRHRNSILLLRPDRRGRHTHRHGVILPQSSRVTMNLRREDRRLRTIFITPNPSIFLRRQRRHPTGWTQGRRLDFCLLALQRSCRLVWLGSWYSKGGNFWRPTTDMGLVLDFFFFFYQFFLIWWVEILCRTRYSLGGEVIGWGFCRIWQEHGKTRMERYEFCGIISAFGIILYICIVSWRFLHVSCYSFPLSSITQAYNQKKPPYVLLWFFFVSCNFALTWSMYNDVRNLWRINNDKIWYIFFVSPFSPN